MLEKSTCTVSTYIHALVHQGLEPLPKNTESATACLNKSCS